MKIVKTAAACAAAFVAAACTPLTLSWADLSGRGPEARPPVFAAGPAPMSAAQWEADEAPRLRRLFETHVYGFLPESSKTLVRAHTVLDEAAFGGLGRLEEYRIEARPTFSGVETSTDAAAPGGFVVDLLVPTAAKGRAPVILMETFCPRWETVPHPKVFKPANAPREMGGPMAAVATYVFGRYICTPPVADILKRGYGIAAIYPGEVVPDDTKSGMAALATLAAGHADEKTRWGAIAAWSWVFSRTIDALETNERVDPHGLILWGHSRYGKAALVAAAFDSRVDAVIAHQSGAGGASLSREKKGESVKTITGQYPHWFSETYAGYAGREAALPVDQHQLLALIAPRPLLLGNARRDVWSDPNGAYRAARGADPVYKLYGAKGLTQTTLRRYDPAADLAFWIRPGTHGVVKEDWPAFLDFLDAHFKDAGTRG